MFNRIAIFFLLITSLCFVVAQPALAICPICTVAVGAGVGLAQWLGVDDMITGLWVGALLLCLVLITSTWLRNKNFRLKGLNVWIFLLYYLITLYPLVAWNILGHPLNKVFGVDKLLIGVFFGTVLLLLSNAWYKKIKIKNNGHPDFPFQKVIMPISILLIFSALFYFLTLPR